MAKDFILYFLGILVTVVPLVKEIKRKNWGYASFIIVCFGLILWLGLDKITRDNETEKENQITVGNLSSKIATLKESYSTDSVRDIQFQNTLTTKFKIGRDSITNLPYLLKTEKLEINSNNGTNLGNIGGANNQVTNNFGTNPREVTEKILREIIEKMPNKNLGVELLARVGDQESHEFRVKLKTELMERGYKNVFVSGIVNDQVIGDDEANLKRQKEFTVTFRDGQYSIAIPGNL